MKFVAVSASIVCATVWCATPVSATHNTPISTVAMTLPLVVAYPTCGSPTTCRVDSVLPNSAIFQACPSGTPATSLRLGPKGKGKIVMRRVPKSKAHPTGDVKIVVTIVDVRDSANSNNPYTGTLRIDGFASSTDDFCASDYPTCATVLAGATCTTVYLPVIGLGAPPIPCTLNATGTMSTCKVTSFVNEQNPSLFGGAVVMGHGQNIAINQMLIRDASNNPFLEPGLLAP